MAPNGKALTGVMAPALGTEGELNRSGRIFKLQIISAFPSLTCSTRPATRNKPAQKQHVRPNYRVPAGPNREGDRSKQQGRHCAFHRLPRLAG